ncbi:putative heme oxygenase [Bradyrhizobium sp. ORS 278]|uniref:biliverdin-producing heme oxygenase n=1 Tax=Bradyrhizobium sp. (strain ORS 278) TaxID=114615 RepID=UPI00015076C9|nr:biliverdin-producing heme oxygenase [Bradyrhizobium sp. ORS 278]CAL75864.1 putative heme oxygenase [Bradyrhizobium sp. ORS 278]
MLLAAISDDSSRTTSTGIRERLKAATASAHHALDERLAQLDLTTTAHYRRFLQASAAALWPLEQLLEESGAAGIVDDWTARRRSDALRADLADLQGTAAPLQLSGDSLARPCILGKLYVLEGSRLGAVYLLRIVSASADPRVRRATRYLRHGAGQGLWPSFLARLAREPMTSDDEGKAIAGAHAAFALFATAMAAA